MVTTLAKLRVRELRQGWAQGVAVALVVACGVACWSGFAGTRRSLLVARDDYYQRERFGEVFAQVRRAPAHVAGRLTTLTGVAEVDARVVGEGPLELEHVSEAVTARFVSLAEPDRPGQNRVRLRAGRLPEAGRRNEAIVCESLARARHLRPGDTVTAVLAGRRQPLRLVGVGLSPEFVFSARPGEMLPDEAHYGVVWLPRSTLAAALDMTGAFNDVSLRLTHEVPQAAVLAEVDRLLASYGGLAAYTRAEHLSARFLDNEIDQLAWMARVLPAVFLGVAAFLLHIVMNRWVAARRELIATLKALGYGDRVLARHYAVLVLTIVGLGVACGAALGDWLGQRMTALYALSYFHLPEIPFQRDWFAWLAGALVSFAAATLGTAQAVRAVVRLPPAAALQAEPPPAFRATGLERWWWSRRLSLSTRLVLRQLARRPARAVWTVVGVALGESLLVVGAFFQDAMTALLHRQFNVIERADATVTFEHPLGRDALRELANLPGVLRVTGFRSAPVQLTASHRSYRTVILGVPANAGLRRIVDRHRGVREPSDTGLQVGDAVAQRLQLRRGDTVELALLEGRRPRRLVRVTDVIAEDLGTLTYVDSAQLNRWLGEDDLSSGAWLDLAGTSQPASSAQPLLDQALRTRPAVVGVSHRSAALQSFRRMLTDYLLVFASVLVVFAAIIDIGVLYNAARIALAERQRDLATLRVLGMTHGEVTALFLGEQILLLVAALPVGVGLGYGLAWWSAQAMATELFRIPLVATTRTVGFAATVTVVAAALVAWRLARHVRKLAMVDVLKARE